MGELVMSPRRGAGPRTARGGMARTAAQQHREWLELVDTDGPFLSVPVMTALHPQGMPRWARPAGRPCARHSLSLTAPGTPGTVSGIRSRSWPTIAGRATPGWPRS